MPFLALLIVCGALISVQATINSALGRSLGMLNFAVVFSAIQLLCALPGFLLGANSNRSWSFESLRVLGTLPLWQYLGAVMGVGLLIGIAYGVGRVGTFVGMVALLLGQLSMGLMIDQYGFFGAPIQPFSFARLLGLIFVLLGVWLVKPA